MRKPEAITLVRLLRLLADNCTSTNELEREAMRLITQLARELRLEFDDEEDWRGWR